MNYPNRCTAGFSLNNTLRQTASILKLNSNILLHHFIPGSFTFLFLLFLQLTGYAQLKPLYDFAKDDSLIKKDYYKKASAYNTAAINSIAAAGKKEKEQYKTIYKDRFEVVESLLTSSQSYTTVASHEYMQRMVKKIVAANPELKNLELRVVFSRDGWPNAYSIGDGTIAFNAGLFIFLQNEAEMAFILCHELAHYYLDHSGTSIKKYVATINSDDFQKELKRLSKEQYKVNEQLTALAKNIVFDSRKHSRSHEAESDRFAIRFMKNTGYNILAARSVLQLLDKIDDSSLFKPVQVEQVFNFTEYPFKKKWIQKESSIFSQVGEADTEFTQKEKDSLKTHPDCSKRITLLQDSLAAADSTAKFFLIDETYFRKLKKDFIAEITEYNYQKKNLSLNLYYSLLMLNSDDYKPLGIYSVARCLNDIYEKQQQHTLEGSISHETKGFPEDYNLLLRMLDKLKLDEIAAINANFCRKYKEEMKDYEGFTQQMIKAISLK